MKETAKDSNDETYLQHQFMGRFIKNCTGVILAGGENTRIPVLKAFIEVNGEKIIEKNLKIMKQLFKEVFIVTNQPEAYFYLETAMLGDIYSIRGPMTGIFTSLFNSSYNWVFISACDMPFINKHLITYMAEKRDNFDAVVPNLKGKLEPLFAFYSKRLTPEMEKAIFVNKIGLKDFLNNKKVKYISIEEIKRIDTKAASFVNINTVKDLKFYLGRRAS